MGYLKLLNTYLRSPHYIKDQWNVKKYVKFVDIKKEIAMKETMTAMQIMEMMVDVLNEKYPDHKEKGNGSIQFHLDHLGEKIDCYILADTTSLKFRPGIIDSPTVTVKSTFYKWLDLAGGKLNPVIAVMTRQIRFKGNTSFFNILPKKTYVDKSLIPTDPVSKFERNPQKNWVKPKNIVILSSSPRGEKGYTDYYLQPFIKGMEKNAKVRLVHLKDYKINPCDGCFYCWMDTPGKCKFQDKDGFHELAEILRPADIIVYAFPIYTDSIPGILKNYFDRSVSRAYPYMIEGMKRVRHPRRFIHENQSMVVFSICGFFEEVNFKPVKEYFKALAHNRHCPVIGEFYRTTAIGLHGNPFGFKKLQTVLEALEKAGEEIVEFGKIKRKTQKRLHTKFGAMSRDIDKINQWWVDREGSRKFDY